jgi:hypothetical protein
MNDNVRNIASTQDTAATIKALRAQRIAELKASARGKGYYHGAMVGAYVADKGGAAAHATHKAGAASVSYIGGFATGLKAGFVG